jgi:phosphoglycerate dehydrogenase-like enzyme
MTRLRQNRLINTPACTKGPASMTLTIHITDQVYPSVVQEAEAAAPGATVRFFDTQEQFEAEIAEADIAATVHLSPAALKRARKLKWVHSWSAGPDHTLTPELARSDVPVTSSKGNGAIPLAEHAMMLMLMLDRDMPRSFRAQRERRWDRFFHGELNGRTCGIIGTGHTGTDLAIKAKAFHMRVVGLRRGVAPAPDFDRMYRHSEMHEFLAECDFLVMTAPYTAETAGMIDAEALSAIKPGAFYVCVSRGGIVDDDALLDALRDGRIAGAGLDAHAVEPLPPSSPFYDLPGVILTPHHGAVTMSSRRRAVEIFLENLSRFQRGEPFVNLVDKSAGY